ncbi:hemolysin family protein [Nocardioides sp. Bht2]|uniref:hemolysin family protein n=1 Tax=Nocardioides sp. Bht2 TaxID=3392297 RepID=UPI0039B4AC3D
MENPWVVAAATTAIIVLSAFFVAVEFALLAAKRHRLEDRAGESRSARAALRSANELTVLLAGCQLGITAATLALGAITKPAVHHWLTPAIENIGAPYWVADVAGFVLALIVVTFLHLVVGEMAPKSWAIGHPESSAIALALPMRAFMAVSRPLLTGLNSAANWCLRRVGVEPADQVAGGQNAEDLRHLVEHSASVGALDLAYSAQITSALDLRSLTIGDLLKPDRTPTAVAHDATAAEVQEMAARSGHLRILVRSAVPGQAPSTMVHVRDTLLNAPDQSVAELARPVLEFAAETPLYAALGEMRETRTHLVIVRRGDGSIGVVTLADVLANLLPQAA